ncbi:unnamed protein product [Polarella glacialis]|uniref:Protochlorophyllide reductase n=2 Tax=Polarella glacialis TaxID=89957 RepID=A0A813KJR3_POLGL|nr:unnamed protein product [Polarella glacialis]
MPRQMRALTGLVLAAAALCAWHKSSVALTVPRRVLVTGGNKGIGKALCKQLAVNHGFHVLLGSRDEARGKAAIQSIVDANPACKEQIELLIIDTSSDASVAAAAACVAAKFGTETQPLYGIINNAGLGFTHTMADTLAVNAYGPKRVCDAFLPLLCASTGRVVNTASASGPMFVARSSDKHRQILTDPDVSWEQIEELMNEAVAKPKGMEPYGFSKACLNAYTRFLARKHPKLIINSVSPGFIDTDITRGMGATKRPDEGTKAAIFCLMGDVKGSGCYYGSDCVRSPLDRYREPGSAAYAGP